MEPNVESLNVAAATAMTRLELPRRRIGNVARLASPGWRPLGFDYAVALSLEADLNSPAARSKLADRLRVVEDQRRVSSTHDELAPTAHLDHFLENRKM